MQVDMVTSPAPPCLVTPAATVSCRRQRQPQRPPRPRVIQATAKASKAKARLVQQPVAKCPVHTTGLQPPRPSFHISTRPTVTAGNSLKSRPQTPNKGLRGCHYHRTSIHAHLQVSFIGSTEVQNARRWFVNGKKHHVVRVGFLVDLEHFHPQCTSKTHHQFFMNKTDKKKAISPY